MNLKLNGIAAAMFAGGLLVGGNAMAQVVVDGTPCENPLFEGLGQETCTQPNPYPGEGVLFTAAEQVVSIVSAISDDVGCPAVMLGGPINVKIAANLSFPQSAQTTIGTAGFSTLEQVNSQHYSTPFVHNGVRVHVTGNPTNGVIVKGLFGQGLTALSGTYFTDGPYSIMHGNSDFTYNGDQLDEHLIKDFYQGIARQEEVAPDNTIRNTRVIRDNGLEVTTKKATVSRLDQESTVLVGHPKGKWRQTSYYRGPDGGDGALTYTKVRIAPFGAAECALQLTGAVTGSLSFPVFNGKVTVFPLQSNQQSQP
jgi:hypothetical protein